MAEWVIDFSLPFIQLFKKFKCPTIGITCKQRQLYNNTPSKAIVNAAYNITYRPLIEAVNTGHCTLIVWPIFGTRLISFIVKLKWNTRSKLFYCIIYRSSMLWWSSRTLTKLKSQSQKRINERKYQYL